MDSQKYLGIPSGVFIISDLETLRVVADPLRLQVLALLRRRPATVKQLARELSLPPKKLYYHINLLEEHGLIRVAGTRVVSGIIEKHYQVTAHRLSVARALLSTPVDLLESAEGLDVFLSVVLDHSKSEIARSVQAGLIDVDATRLDRRGLALGRLWLRLSPERAEEFHVRFKALTREFARPEDQQATDARDYEVLLGIYPVLGPAAVEEHHNDESGAGQPGPGGAAES